MSELLDIVNENDVVMGNASYDEIYAQKHSHRIVHIFVLNDKKEVYFQKRALTKSFLPGYYCSSAGGHVRSGESYQEAAQRELKEEIGLNSQVKFVGSQIFESNDHKRLIQIFVTYANEGFSFEDGEVMDGEFIDLNVAYNLVSKNDKIHPQLKVCYAWLYENKLNSF